MIITSSNQRGEWGILRMKKGFSLIELLVVIAIIAILAGIAFPVFARTKDSAYRSADMSKLNELRTALQLYRTDQGGYPPALLGYATGYLADGVTPGDPNPTAANIVPADRAISALYPKRVNALATFQPSYNRGGGDQFNKQFTAAEWPNGAVTGPGTSGQAYGTGVIASRCDFGTMTDVPRYFYNVSGFDVAPIRDSTGAIHNEMHYSLFWTGYTVPPDPCVTSGLGSSADNPRQLGYLDPPDNTVVTWDTFFREYDGNNLQAEKRDIVLFLGGSAKLMNSQDVATKAWAVQP
jgi:prepilin-type N-terminal cleavage/methylation domain-containing protein